MVSWEIKVWHEEVGDRMRLSIEAGTQVPDDVISAVAGSYWFEEVQLTEEDWIGDDDFVEPGEPGHGFHG